MGFYTHYRIAGVATLQATYPLQPVIYFREFQRGLVIPPVAMYFQEVPRSSRECQKVPMSSKEFQGVQMSSREFQGVPMRTCDFRGIERISRELWPFLLWPRNYRNESEII